MVNNKLQFVEFTKEVEEFGADYAKEFERVLNSGWYILGKEVEEFEHQFADYLGTRHVIGVANGLEAIQICLMALGIREGDEVITTPLSAVATTIAILLTGAKPIYVDIKSDGQIDEKLVQQAITKNTKAIIPVHLYGNPCSISELKEIAKANNLVLIEDAAQAQGSLFAGQKLGTFGDLGCFSFYPTKNLGAIGDAGAICTKDDKLANLCRSIRDYGQEGKYIHTQLGLNSRLDEVHAAILKIKLQHLDILNKRRALKASVYKNSLRENELKIINCISGGTPNYHQFVVLAEKRNQLQQYLKDNGIPTLVHYPVLIPDQPMFDGKYKNLDLPVGRDFVERTLSLPCSPYHSEEQITEVVSAINTFYN